MQRSYKMSQLKMKSFGELEHKLHENCLESTSDAPDHNCNSTETSKVTYQTVLPCLEKESDRKLIQVEGNNGKYLDTNPTGYDDCHNDINSSAISRDKCIDRTKTTENHEIKVVERDICVDDVLTDGTRLQELLVEDEELGKTEDRYSCKLKRMVRVQKKKYTRKTSSEMVESVGSDLDTGKEESVESDDRTSDDDDLGSDNDDVADIDYEANSFALQDLQDIQEWVRQHQDDFEDDFFDDLVFLENQDDLEGEEALNLPPKPAYPRSQLKENSECQVCLLETSTRDRLCCRLPVCDDCMDIYVKEKVLHRCVTIPCIGQSCNSNIFRDEVLDRLDKEVKEKYYQYLVDANGDPMVKTCPRCSHIYKIGKEELSKGKKKGKNTGVQVTCPKCAIHWCFPCQAPWHEKMTCKEYNKGNKLLKTWAKEFNRGQNNAQKCPKCHVFIERRSGCDHMTCSECATSFCYRCGERYFSIKMIGDHHGTFSPLGCKYNLLPGRPVARKAVRGSILGAKVLGGVVLGALVVVGGALVLATSVITLPIYGVHKYRKHRHRIRYIKKRLAYNAKVPPIPLAAAVQTPGVVERQVEPGLISSDGANTGDAESKAASIADATPDSESEAEHAQEVEVWVHYQHQGEPQAEQEMNSEYSHQSKNKEEVAITTAKMSKDGNETDVLYVTTSYTNKDSSGQVHGQGTNETQEGEGAQLPNKNCKSLKEIVTSEQKMETEKNTSTDQEVNNDIVSGDENSTCQGCFVQIFGKKLPVVWEKDTKDLGITEESKSPSGDKESKYSTGSLEKKHAKSVVLSSESKWFKQRGQSSSERSRTHPDVVNCSLQNKQGKVSSLKGDVDPDVLTAIKCINISDSDSENSEGCSHGNKQDNDCVLIHCSRL